MNWAKDEERPMILSYARSMKSSIADTTIPIWRRFLRAIIAIGQRVDIKFIAKMATILLRIRHWSRKNGENSPPSDGAKKISASQKTKSNSETLKNLKHGCANWWIESTSKIASVSERLRELWQWRSRRLSMHPIRAEASDEMIHWRRRLYTLTWHASASPFRI